MKRMNPRVASAIRHAAQKLPEREAIPEQKGIRPDGFRPVQKPQPQAYMQEPALQKEAKAIIPPARGRTEIYTYFTDQFGRNVLLYSAEDWVKAKFFLETAGPVDVGTRQDLLPVGSGKGIDLPTDVEVEFVLNKGDRIFIAANALNRVRFILEPIPWLGQIAQLNAEYITEMKKK